MDRMALPHVALLAVGLVLAVLLICYALHTRSLEPRIPSFQGQLRSFFINGLRESCYALLGIGAFGTAAALLLAVWARPEGLLETDGLYTLRMPEALEVLAVADADGFSHGEVIASFRSPQRQAELSALTLQCDVLRAQQAVLESQPLEQDDKLVRRQAEMESELRHLRSAIEQITIEQSQAQREGARDIQAKKTKTIELAGTLSQLPQEISQGRSANR